MPSAGNFCKFNEITHQQEKVILKSIAQRGSYFASFMYAMSNIMRDNCIDKKEFNILDRFFYGLYTRIYCFGSNIEYLFSCDSCSRKIKYALRGTVVYTKDEIRWALDKSIKFNMNIQAIKANPNNITTNHIYGLWMICAT